MTDPAGSTVAGANVSVFLRRILFLLLILIASSSVQAASVHKKILLFSSEDPDRPGVSLICKALRSTLKEGSPDQVDIYAEYLDNLGFPASNYENEIVSLLRRKYNGVKFDLIFTVQPTALRLLLENQTEIFPDTPIVFITVDRRDVADLELGPNVTGVWAQREFRPTLELALAVHPETRRVVVVAGTSAFDSLGVAKAREDFRDYEDRLEFTYLIGLALQDMQRELRSLPGDSLVFYTSFLFDKEGNAYRDPEYLSAIAPATAAPIYGTSDTQIGSGIVGGRIFSFEACGKEGAETGLRILGGESPSAIAPHGVSSVTMFDWRELQRWGISEKSLPPGSIVRFRVPSFWDQYKWRAVALISLFIVQSALIAGLVINRSRRKRAEAALTKNEAQLAGIIGSAMDAIISIDESQRVVVFNDAAQRMFGCARHEVVGQPLDRFIPERFRVSHRRHVRAFGETDVTTKSMGLMGEIRGCRADGEEFPIEASISQLELQGQKFYTVILRDITERQKLLGRLKRSEQDYRGLFENAHDAIIIFDPMGETILEVNRRACDIYGFSHAEFIGMSLRTISRDVSKGRTRISETLQKHGTVNFETVQYRKDGSELFLEINAAVIEYKGHQAILSINRDVTERKRAEEALRESEERFRQMADTLPEVMWITSLNPETVLYVSPSFECIWGFSAEDLYRNPHLWIEAIHPEDRDGVASRFARWISGEDVSYHNVEFRIVQPNGNIRWIHERGVTYVDEKGKPYRVSGISTDITEHKLAEEALRESEERFRNMADTAPVLIWVSGRDKLCSYFNQQWLTFTGRTMEEELGNGWTEGLHPEDYQRCVETYTTAFDLRKPFTMEYRLRRADGQFRWILDSGTPRFSPSETFLGYIGSCIDITERKAAEEALEDLSGQLIRARENECARIARELHDDLNQRMALISIELDQLGQSPLGTDGTLRKQLQGIIKQTAEVSQEIHRISYDLHPSKLVQLGLVAAVKSLCDELRSNHELKIEFFDEGVPVGLPQDISLCLYRIVQESLNNVIRHSGAEEAEVELLGTRDEVRLRVSDSGIGFDIESPGLKKGLGMLGMRERLRLVGGSISIDSKPSKGTEINVRVPLGRIGHDYEDHSPDEKSRAARI